MTTLDDAFITLSGRAVLSIQFDVRVAGRLDADRLAAALRTAVDAHPMARARLGAVSVDAAGLDWEIPDTADHVALEITNEPVAVVRSRSLSRTAELTSSPTFRASLVRSDGGDYVLLNLHHATVDAVSAVRLMTSIARAYADAEDQIGGPELAEARDLAVVNEPRGLRDALPRAARVALDLAARARLTRVAADGGDPEATSYAATELRLDAQETLTCLGLKPQGATLNDLAVAAAALAILRWNRNHEAPIGETVSIVMPVNLRPAEWSTEVVSNFAGYLPVVLPTRIEDALTAAAEQAGQHIRPVKETRTARPISGPATTLSNLGKVTLPAFGDAGEVTEVWFSPPCFGDQVPIAIGMAGLGNELFLSLRTNRRHVGDVAAERFARLLREVLTGASPAME